MQKLLYSLALFVIAATLLPLIRWSDWWIRAFDFPRPQFSALGLLTVFVFVWFWDVRNAAQAILFGALVLCVGYQVWRMMPYTPLATKQVLSAEEPAEGSTVRLLVANVLMTNRHADRLLELIDQQTPDVVLLAETDERWQRDLEPLTADYPHREGVPLDNTYGMLLYSRLELVHPQVRYLVDDEIPSVKTGLRLRDGRRARFYGLHPEPPSPTEAPDTVERDAELLIVAREIAELDEPAIVAGDLNDVAWSASTRLMQRISGLLDPRIGRGLYSTFHAKVPFVRWPLDHVFHSDDFRLVRLATLPGFGSDHFPILIELELAPEAALFQEAPPPGPEDHEEAEQKIEEALDEESEKATAGPPD